MADFLGIGGRFLGIGGRFYKKCTLDLYDFSNAFHSETNHLICSANEMQYWTEANIFKNLLLNFK